MSKKPEKHSREWWKTRLPLIQQFVEGKTIVNICDEKVLTNPTFDDPNRCTIQKPKNKWLKTMWVKEKKYALIVLFPHVLQ